MTTDINFLEILSHSFVWKAFLGAVLAGALCGFLGPYLAWRNLGLLGASISHASLSPIALSMWLGLSYFALLYPFAVLLALLIAYLKEKNFHGLDSVLAIFYSGFMALGVVILSQLGYGSTEVVHYLFGEILLISNWDLVFLALISLFIFIFALYNKKSLLLSLIHPEIAKMENPKLSYLTYISFCCIGLCIAASIKIMGIVLMTSLMMVPTFVASKYTKSLSSHFVFCIVFGVLISVVGMLASLYWNLPSGASIASVAMIVFVLSLVIPKRT